MLLYILSLLGVGVSAVSGALSAGRKHYDLMGVISLGLVTAIGGGTLRDLLIERRPIFWIADPTYLYVILMAAGGTMLYARFRKPLWEALLVADALGLAFFTISGAQVAEERGAFPVIVVAMGTVTGAAGGLLRDLLCQETPLIFRHTEPLYATASIVGASVYLSLERCGLSQAAAASFGMAAVALVRFAAIKWSWRLPGFRLAE
jgi:uncharacterized membrane protein YeiH